MQHPSRPDSYKPGPKNGVQVKLAAIFRLSAALFTVSTLTVESIEGRQDLEILGPSRRFLGSDDVTEIGDHDVDRVDPHWVSLPSELCVSACNATW